MNKKIKSDIVSQNRISLIIILLVIIMLDTGFYYFARMDSSYPSNPQLLDFMFINILIDSIVFISIAFLYRKYWKIMNLLIPITILAIKLAFNFFMPFNIMVMFYYISIFLILNASIKTKYEMIFSACFFEVVLISIWLIGKMESVEEAYALIIINGVVTITASIVGYYRYKQYIIILNYQQELINQKKIIEKYISLRDLSIDFNNKLLEHSSLSEYLGYILRGIYDQFDKADAACAFVVEGDNFKILSSINYVLPESGIFEIKINEAFSFDLGLMDSVKPVVLNNLSKLDYDKYEKILPCHDGKIIESSLSTPLIKNGKLFGLLNLDSSENNVFTQEDVELLVYFGEQISIALENFKLYSEIRKLSEYDRLTGFRNSWYLDNIVHEFIPIWRKERIDIKVISFDLDCLKCVNDTFGHFVGDMYINKFCEALKTNFPDNDFFIRSGGDEFVGIFENISEEELIGKLEALKADLYIEIDKLSEKIFVKFSYGIANLANHHYDFSEAFVSADKKMYENKQENKSI